MKRAEAVELARRYVRIYTEDASAFSPGWAPPEWVVESVLAAANGLKCNGRVRKQPVGK